jgi:hypothetical protein
MFTGCALLHQTYSSMSLADFDLKTTNVAQATWSSFVENFENGIEKFQKSLEKTRCSQWCIVVQNINVKYFALWATQKWPNKFWDFGTVYCSACSDTHFYHFFYMYLGGFTQGNHVCDYPIWAITSRMQHYELSQCSCSMNYVRCFSV